MNITALILSLASIGPFTSRAFIPAFITSLILRYGHNIWFLQNQEFVKLAENSPTWFTHGGVVIALGIISTLEIVATKNEDIREIMEMFISKIKPITAICTSFGILSISDTALIETIQNNIETAGYSVATIVGLLTGFGVFFVVSIRSEIMNFLCEIDPEDNLYIRFFLSWLEDAFCIIIPILIFLLPTIIIGISLLFFIIVLYLLKKYLEKKDEQSKSECPNCKSLNYKVAISCFHCSHTLETPNDIGFLGGAKKTIVSNIENHQLKLIEKKRCSVCGNHLKKRKVIQECSKCNNTIMDTKCSQINNLFHEAWFCEIV